MDKLPIEIIHIICEHLDNTSLLNFMITQKIIQFYLRSILEERKIIHDIIDHISNEDLLNFNETKQDHKTKRIAAKVLKERISQNIRLDITYILNNKIERWTENNVEHRTSGPAYIVYHKNRKKEYETWIQFGRKHRSGGKPAVIFYNINSKMYYMGWFTNGVYVTDKFTEALGTE